jgi:hypothetical protein
MHRTQVDHRTQPAQADGEGDVSEGRHKTRFVGDIAAWAQLVTPVNDIALSRNKESLTKKLVTPPIPRLKAKIYHLLRLPPFPQSINYERARGSSKGVGTIGDARLKHPRAPNPDTGRASA